MFTRQAHIPSPEQLRDELPLTKELTAIKKERDRLTMDVIAGRTEKLPLEPLKITSAILSPRS